MLTKTKTRGPGALTHCLTFCQMKLIYSFMDNGNVGEVTSRQSAIHLQFGKSPKKVVASISRDLHAFSKVWLKLDENCGSSRQGYSVFMTFMYQL